jgi:hypothetical protein
MQIINQYSMLWSGLLILGLLGFFILRKGFTIYRVLTLLVVGIALVLGWLVLRPDQASTNELTQLKAEVGQGQAVLLELQSPY